MTLRIVLQKVDLFEVVPQGLSTIPIPPAPSGLRLKHDGTTEQQRNYKEHTMDCAAGNAAKWRAMLACNGPTSTVGVTLGGWTKQQ